MEPDVGLVPYTPIGLKILQELFLMAYKLLESMCLMESGGE